MGDNPVIQFPAEGGTQKEGEEERKEALKVDPEENQDKQRVGVEQNRKLRLPVDSRTY